MDGQGQSTGDCSAHGCARRVALFKIKILDITNKKRKKHKIQNTKTKKVENEKVKNKPIIPVCPSNQPPAPHTP